MNNIFESAFDAIDDQLIAEAKSPAIRIAARRKKIIISSVAACVAAVLIAIPSVKVISDMNDRGFTTSDDVEVIYKQEIIYEQASSSEVDNTASTPSEQQNTSSGTTGNNSSSGTTSLLGMGAASDGYHGTTITVNDLYFTKYINKGGSTTSYEKVYVPNVEYLYINPIPTDKYVTIYEGYYQNEIDETEAQSLADKYFPKIADMLGIATPRYEIRIDTESINVSSVTDESDNYYNIGVTNMQNRNIFTLYTSFDKPVIMNGETVTINQSQNDTEIIIALSGIKKKLSDLFNVSFDSAKIIRDYGSYGNYGADFIDIYFYNSDGHLLNSLKGDHPYSDFISIRFDNHRGYEGDVQSATDLYDASIHYWSFRTDNNSHMTPVTEAELLPLEKAEEYLNKGYVLSMGGCALCQKLQEPVDFAAYDYVSLEYEGGFNVGELAIPYYAFYKNIGTAENGNMTFAKTYVPAVEVEGYEEYFENKHANHNN